jgi:hypothetical protein
VSPTSGLIASVIGHHQSIEFPGTVSIAEKRMSKVRLHRPVLGARVPDLRKATELPTGDAFAEGGPALLDWLGLAAIGSQRSVLPSQLRIATKY